MFRLRQFFSTLGSAWCHWEWISLMDTYLPSTTHFPLVKSNTLFQFCHPSIHPSFSAYPIQDRGVTRDYSSYNGGQITNLSREFICLFNLKNSASLPLTCQCHCSPALLQALLTPPPSLILPVGSGGEVYSLLTWFSVYHICRNKPRHPTLNVLMQLYKPVTSDV